MMASRQALSAQAIFDEAFSLPRTARSEAYRSGCLSALRFRIEGEQVSCPYHPGDAAFDAFQAGIDEGHALARAALARVVGS